MSCSFCHKQQKRWHFSITCHMQIEADEAWINKATKAMLIVITCKIKEGKPSKIEEKALFVCSIKAWQPTIATKFNVHKWFMISPLLMNDAFPVIFL